MKKAILLIALFLLIFITNNELLAQNFDSQKRLPIPPEMLYNSAQGREFWIAIPPNEADGQPLVNTNDV